MGGEIETFYTVEQAEGDLLYKSFNKWTTKDYDVSHMDEETANRVARRYPGSRVEKGFGYNITFRKFEELEPNASQAIRDAVILAKRDGQSLERVLVTAEASYNAAKN